jgi:hypothetical protein
MTTSLESAIAELRENLNDGTHCPCCGQWAKRYKRKLNSAMARGLVWLVGASKNAPDGGWVDVPADAPKWLTKTNQHTTLRWWGLIERMPSSDDSSKKHSGMWRPTELGVEFVRGATKVPAYVYHYNNEVDGWSDEQIDIREAFGTKFNYTETMQSAGFGEPAKIIRDVTAPRFKVVRG